MNNQGNKADANYATSPRQKMEANGGYNNNNNYTNMVNRLQPKFLKPIVQTKVVQVPKEVYVEKVVEVPQIKIVKKFVEDIKPIYKYKNVYKPKIVYVEKVKHVDKIIYEEKIIEVPQTKYVEKIVEVPVYINREKIIPVPRYMVVEKVIPVLKTTKTEQFVEIPEIKSPVIDVNKQVEAADKVEVKDLKDNQTTEVTDAEQMRIFSHMAEAISSTNAESTIKVEVAYGQNTVNAYQEQEQKESQYIQVTNQQYAQNAYKDGRYAEYNKMFYQTQKYNGANDKMIRFSNVLPRIKIAKTPHNYSKNCYCSCS